MWPSFTTPPDEAGAKDEGKDQENSEVREHLMLEMESHGTHVSKCEVVADEPECSAARSSANRFRVSLISRRRRMNTITGQAK